MRNVGTFRSFRLRAVMRPAWFEEEFYKAFHASRGFHDHCMVIFPVHEDFETLFSFHREGVKKNLTAEEEALATYTLRGIKWFLRQIGLSYGLLIAGAPLSSTQRQFT